MGLSAGLQLLTCLLVCMSSAHGIMVKYGTRKGPILPPTPEPEQPPTLPYRTPAPVWEERSNDSPDPNANWRPQHYNPHPRYTQVVYSLPSPPPTFKNVQRFVNSYLPKHEPKKAEPIPNYFTPAQVLSSQSLPGFGLRYFIPNDINNSYNNVEDDKEESNENHIESNVNNIESNEVEPRSHESNSDFQWKNEKDSVSRNVRTTQKVAVPVYIWPGYVAHVHQ